MTSGIEIEGIMFDAGDAARGSISRGSDASDAHSRTMSADLQEDELAFDRSLRPKYLKDYLGISIKEPTKIDWKNCANLTSGIFNIFYEDEKANEFDKTKKVTPLEIKYLSTKLSAIQKSIQGTYPEQDSEISMFIGKICSFRNLFKNARYGGFHHDRQLGVLKQYEVDFSQYSYLWEECYKLRKDIFPSRFLGELHGWDGIRKERKKIWLTTGKTGVENE